MQIIDVPGVGEVEFPDEMGDDEIVAAVRSLSAPPLAASHGSEPVYKPPQVGAVESGVRGGIQGASFGWGDEVAAAVDAALPNVLRNDVSRRAVAPGLGDLVKGGAEDTFGARYRRARDFYRSRNADAEEANPGTYLAGQVTGGVAPALAGGAPALGGRLLARAAGQGAAQGAGYSDATEVRGLVGDTALGAAVGLAGHGAGQVVGKVGSAALRKGGDLIRSGTARAGAQAAKEVSEEIASAAGKLGGEVQKGSRQVENLMRLEGSMTPQQRALYQQLEAAGIVPNLQQSVAGSTLEALPSQAATIGARKAELAALQAAAPQTAAARTSRLLTPQVKADTKSFLKSYAEPVAWAVGAQQLGDALGLDPAQQGIFAGAAGMVGGRTRAGKALMTRLRRPAHEAATGRLLQRLGSAPSTPAGQALLRALQRSATAAGVPALVADDE